MNLSHNTVLITGGASGIGLALATRFLQAGSTVIVCGRRTDQLAKAQQQYPALQTQVADVATAAGRQELAAWATATFPALNVLVNNAGVQYREPVTTLAANWEARRQEMAINFEAPVHLTGLLLTHLQSQPNATIINVSSGLAFTPMSFAPVYCATKAALHSFTISLRQELASTGVQVLEIVPPAVNTDLGGVGLHTSGEPVDAFADAVLARLAAGELEVGYGTSEQARLRGR